MIVRYAAPYQYWDTGTTAGLGGSGTWGGSNWTFDPTGGAGITPGSFTNTARAAVFNSSVSSTVTVAGSQAAGGLFVSQGFVRFNDGGSGAINLGSGTASISGGQANFNVGLTATGGINIGNAATLGGSGTITGLTTFNGGTHSPGNSPGVQTFASGITYAAPTTVKWELWGNTTSNSGTVFDQIIVSGGTLAFSATTTLALDFGAVGSSVNWNDSFWGTSRTGTNGWLLYDVTGPSAVTGLGGSGTLSPLTSNLQIQTSSWLDASGTSFSTARPNASFSLFQDPTSGDVYVAYAVPEPTSLAMLAVGSAAAILAYRRCRRRRAAA